VVARKYKLFALTVLFRPCGPGTSAEAAQCAGSRLLPDGFAVESNALTVLVRWVPSRGRGNQ